MEGTVSEEALPPPTPLKYRKEGSADRKEGSSGRKFKKERKEESEGRKCRKEGSEVK